MPQRPFGFSKHDERQPSELESKLGVFISIDKAPKGLVAYGDKFTEMYIGDAQLIGVYRGTTEDGYHVICPVVAKNPKFCFAGQNFFSSQ